MPKFTDALDRSAEEIKRPPVLPVGHYIWQIDKFPDVEEFTSSRTGDTFERLTFLMTCLSAHDDVDPDELDSFGNVSGQKNRKVFLFNTTDGKEVDYERSEYNLKRFLVDHCGVDEEGKTLGQLLEDAVGAQFLGEIKHRPDPDDPEIVYAEVGRTSAV